MSRDIIEYKLQIENINHRYVFTQQPLKYPGYCRRPSARAGVRVVEPRLRSQVRCFSRIIFKHGKDIHCPKISYEYEVLPY